MVNSRESDGRAAKRFTQTPLLFLLSNNGGKTELFALEISKTLTTLYGKSALFKSKICRMQECTHIADKR